MKQETQAQKVLIVFLLSLALLAFISVASLQIKKNGENSLRETTNELPSMDRSYENDENQMPEEIPLSEVFESEDILSEEDFLLLEEDLMEEEAFIEQDMKDMERDADFMLAE